MIIYRVVSKETSFVSKWFTSKAKCNRLIRHIQFSYPDQLICGTKLEIEMAELEMEEG